MHWLHTLDVNLFRLINETSGNSFFDSLMRFLSGNAYFFPALLISSVGLIWKGGARGRLCVLLLLLIVSLGDAFICNTIKQAVGRPRPFIGISDVHLLVGKGSSNSMPSAHAANWFAATMIAFIYYRRSLWFMLPIAVLVGFSRIYLGVHYPSDVLAGAILGAGYAAASVWTLNAVWQWLGKRWFPLWWVKLPLLFQPEIRVQSSTEQSAIGNRQSALDTHWLRLGYLLIALSLLLKLAYLAGGTIELSEDEAYQWLWSKHLALSYFSKPPLIAYTQFLGTSLWGDSAFGVRFFSPIITAILSLILLRFFAREVNGRVGFILLLIINTTPLLAVGATLMTIDPLSVLFWTAAMLAGWRAVQENSTTRDWLWVGLWMGLGFLSKYTELFQWLCWAVFFVLWPPARKQLRRPGPYLALVINLVCALPVLIWNYQHEWITVAHVGYNAKIGVPWHPTLQFFLDFVVQEAGLLNPVFFIAAIWAAAAFWRHEQRRPLPIYFFSMGAPLFLFYWLYTFHSRVFPNWIAPSVLPLFCLMAMYWHERFHPGARAVKAWLTIGVGLGLVVVIVFHNTNILEKLVGRRLPPGLDPLHRVRGWSETARIVGGARKEFLAEGRPVFIIGDHYGITSQISFYLPKAESGIPDFPAVYYQATEQPKNQFYFWPGYNERKGQNAIYAAGIAGPKQSLWQLFYAFLSRTATDSTPVAQPPPQRLVQQFETVTSLGVYEVTYRGRAIRWVQLFACRGLL